MSPRRAVRPVGAWALAGVLLGACGGAPDGDTGAGPPGDTAVEPWVETLDAGAMHLLVGATPGQGNAGAALLELDLALEERWSLTLMDHSGTAGAIRGADATTAYARTWPPPELGSAIEVVDEDGAVLRARTDVFSMLSFVHGLEEGPDGTWIVADTTAGEVFAFAPEGDVVWTLTFGTDTQVWVPNGIGVGTDASGTTWLAVTLLQTSGTQGDRVEVYTLEADGPHFSWGWAPEDADELWPHGPAVLPDGTVTVALAARGQVVGLRDGAQAWRVPEVPGAMSFPRDAAFLPDGTLIVADGASELLRVADPLGRFEVVDAIAVPGIFNVDLLDCATDICF